MPRSRNEVPFILTVFVIHDDDQLALTNVLDGVFDAV